MDKIRAFIAITLPAGLIDRLKSLQDELKGAVSTADLDRGASARGRKNKKPVSWTRPEGIHLTIKFLGDIDPQMVDKIAGSLERASRGILPFTLSAGGADGGGHVGSKGDGEAPAGWLGGFPSLTNPRVVFTPLAESTELAALHENIERELEELGFDRENRAFHPHLTLARVKSAPAGRTIGGAARGIDAGEAFSFTATEFSLIKSVLGPAGAAYTPLKTIRLTENTD